LFASPLPALAAPGESATSETETAVASAGTPVTQELTILESTLGGLTHYELCHGDDVLWSGVGGDRVEGLLQIIMRITEGEDPQHLTTKVAVFEVGDP
jgi:hypothetical protein